MYSRVNADNLTDTSWPSVSQAPASSSFNDNYLSAGSPSVGSSAVGSPIIPPAMMNEPTPQMDPAPIVNPPVLISYDVPAIVNQLSPQAWDLPLRLVPPTGPVDSILIGLLQRQRGLAISGNSRELVIGPYSPSLRALLNPEQSNSVHLVASVISSLLQRTAEWHVPRASQLLTPHPIWIDQVSMNFFQSTNCLDHDLNIVAKLEHR
jgi:hypothetical protein